MATEKPTIFSSIRGIESQCQYCGQFFRRKQQQKYCSYTCRAKTHAHKMSKNFPTPKPFYQRFWEKVDKTEQCWLWQGKRTPNGYGSVIIPKNQDAYKEPLAHRAAWFFQDGEIPLGINILHTCDTPACVRNDENGWYEVNGILRRRWGHLFEGTTQDNIADKVKKGRQGAARGILSPFTKFTENDVREIRRLNKAGLGKRKIAARYGVGQTTIHQIVRGITWKHLLDEE